MKNYRSLLAFAICFFLICIQWKQLFDSNSILSMQQQKQDQQDEIFYQPSLSSSSSSSSSLISVPKVIDIIEKTPIGSLGPKGTKRRNLLYYDKLFFTALKYGYNAKSIIEVGCANDPFLKYFSWIGNNNINNNNNNGNDNGGNGRRICVAPYQVIYGDHKSGESNGELTYNKHY